MMPGQGKLNLSRTLAVIIAVLGFCPAAHSAPTYKVLHSFTGSDGSGPWGGVTLGRNGSLYGTTAGGGVCGTVFRLAPLANGQWKETILYQFGSGHDPCDPNGRVIFDEEDNLYGTTVGGGAYYYGTVFELRHGAGGRADSILYSFGTHSGDGGEPTAGLVMDGAGNLYGTAPYGGSTIFELTPGSGGWNETVLHRFGITKGDGAGPFAGLILDAAGNLYGTTRGGGTYNGGTVYEIEPGLTGWKEKVLHSFAVNYKDGHTPGWGALLMDGGGNLYGTTAGGGCCGGIVFRLTPGPDGGWKETILYGFKGGAAGFEPNAGVVMDKAGNLYGTTDYGGSAFGCGVIYKLAPRPTGSWKYTVLHIFEGSDGCIPEGNLVLDKAGNLSGGTVLGGTTGNGVIFELTP
ncbi:MAG TPA: choice-of-anchor tandem repeat GloVer-containing protein [Terriglobales bacterium]|nr:choice-of-anchor tandem repeat GloVer-containing protein [Terriglobales bacterium]